MKSWTEWRGEAEGYKWEGKKVRRVDRKSLESEGIDGEDNRSPLTANMNETALTAMRNYLCLKQLSKLRLF